MVYAIWNISTDMHVSNVICTVPRANTGSVTISFFSPLHNPHAHIPVSESDIPFTDIESEN